MVGFNFQVTGKIRSIHLEYRIKYRITIDRFTGSFLTIVPLPIPASIFSGITPHAPSQHKW